MYEYKKLVICILKSTKSGFEARLVTYLVCELVDHRPLACHSFSEANHQHTDERFRIISHRMDKAELDESILYCSERFMEMKDYL